MARNRIHRSLIVFSMALVASILSPRNLWSLEETLVLPVLPSGYGILMSEGIQILPGYRGLPEIMLDEAEYMHDEHTDLLLHFNTSLQNELTEGSYLAKVSSARLSNQIHRLGGASGMFNNDPAGMELIPGQGTFFAPGDFRSDFSFEFWLYPTTMREGEQILAWDGMTSIAGNSQQPQQIRIEFRDSRLVWDFLNFFVRLAPGTNEEIVLETAQFTLANRREIIPRTWHHHMVRYDARRGLLEYLIDGTTEAVVFTTTNQRESGEPFRPLIGERSQSRIKIGQRFTGFIDELRISRKWVKDPQVLRFSEKAGYVIFNPINFRELGVGSKILNIQAQSRDPGASDIGFFYKMTDAPGLALRDDPGWIRFNPGQEITERNQGQFLYIKVELLPDGTGEVSPGVQDIKVTYRPDPPPPAPGGLMVIPQDGAIILRWNRVPANDVQGYLVYYGLRPGQYFGEGSRQGASPINVGDTTELKIEGLENGRLYYFSIASYDQSNNPVYGIHLKRSMSKEVSARPAR